MRATSDPEHLAFEQYLLTIRTRNGYPRYTPVTARTYGNAIAVLLRRGPDLADQLAVAAEPTREPTTRWNTYRSASLAWADWRGDPALTSRIQAVVPPPMTRQDTTAPTPQQWDMIVGSIGRTIREPRRSVLLLVALSGLRIGEVFKLTRRQVELGVSNREIVLMQKGRRVRQWSPSTEDRALLRNLCQHHGWRILRDVFDTTDASCSDKKKYEVAYHEVRKMLRAVCENAGVEYTRPHRYRHAVACDIIAAGGNVITAQKALGHANSRTTDEFYLHSAAEEQIAIKDKAASRHKRTIR